MSYQFGHVDRDERIDLAADEPMGETARRSGLPTPLLTALVMAAFAGGLWFAYDLGTHHTDHAVSAVAAPGAVPLLHADTQPMKVKPDQPGGTPAPARDRLIYNERPGGPAVEKLLPPPEQPAPRPAPAPSSTMAAAPDALPAPAASLPADLSENPAAIPAPPPRKPVPPIRNELAAPAHRPPAARPYPAPVEAPSEIAGGHIRIQLASLRSIDAARIEWQRLKHENPDLLGRLSADAVRANLGPRGVYYRIEAGSFVHLASAEHLCRELQQRRLECSIVR